MATNKENNGYKGGSEGNKCKENCTCKEGCSSQENRNQESSNS